jgi:hypothetical protein
LGERLLCKQEVIGSIPIRSMVVFDRAGRRLAVPASAFIGPDAAAGADGRGADDERRRAGSSVVGSANSR